MNTELCNLFGRRLAQARKMKGWSMEELGNALTPAVSRQAINKYEKGKTMPDSAMLLAFVAALGVKPDYFFRPFTVEVDRVMFRKGPRFPEKKATSIREHVREVLERYLESEELCGIRTAFALPSREISVEEDVRDFASDVRRQLKLGEDGISNVIEVLEDNAIKVIEVSEDASFEGLSGYANDNIPIIVVNDTLPTERKRFALLHELGNLLMRFSCAVSAKEAERLCNIFATELLLPAPVLLSRVGNRRHDISLPELSDLQRQFGISIDAIMESLKRLDVITERRYKGYLRKKRNFPDFKSAVERSIAVPETSGRFIRIVYRALADEKISFSKAAALLNVSVEGIKNQLQLV